MPVEFIPEKKLYEAYLYVQDGDVRDRIHYEKKFNQNSNEKNFL